MENSAPTIPPTKDTNMTGRNESRHAPTPGEQSAPADHQAATQHKAPRERTKTEGGRISKPWQASHKAGGNTKKHKGDAKFAQRLEANLATASRGTIPAKTRDEVDWRPNSIPDPEGPGLTQYAAHKVDASANYHNGLMVDTSHAQSVNFLAPDKRGHQKLGAPPRNLVGVVELERQALHALVDSLFELGKDSKCKVAHIEVSLRDEKTASLRRPPSEAQQPRHASQQHVDRAPTAKHTTPRAEGEAFDPDSICANCQMQGHKLETCAVPDPEFGSIPGCPLHNTKDHDFDNCPSLPDEFDGSVYERDTMVNLLLLNRGNKPQFRSEKICWIDLVKHTFTDPKNAWRLTKEAGYFLPWTSDFSKKVAAAATAAELGQDCLLPRDWHRTAHPDDLTKLPKDPLWRNRTPGDALTFLSQGLLDKERYISDATRLRLQENICVFVRGRIEATLREANLLEWTGDGKTGFYILKLPTDADFKYTKLEKTLDIPDQFPPLAAAKTRWVGCFQDNGLVFLRGYNHQEHPVWKVDWDREADPWTIEWPDVDISIQIAIARLLKGNLDFKNVNVRNGVADYFAVLIDQRQKTADVAMVDTPGTQTNNRPQSNYGLPGKVFYLPRFKRS